MAITAAKLASRVVRAKVGKRVISGNPIKTVETSTNVFVRVFNYAFKHGSLLLAKGLNFLTQVLPNSATDLFTLFVRAVQGIVNFNFNITDAELDKQVEAGWTAFYGSLGGVLGNAVGWAACGVLPGAVIASFNEPLGLYILKNVGEEALQEIAANTGNLCRLLFAQLGNAVVKFLFKKARAFMFPGRKFTNDKPWIIAEKVEETVEEIPNEKLRLFISQFLEEAFDACIEAGYVVASSIDSFLALQDIQNESAMGQEKTVEITFNRDVPNG